MLQTLWVLSRGRIVAKRQETVNGKVTSVVDGNTSLPYTLGMPKRSSKTKPADLNLLAASIVQEATGTKPATEAPHQKNPAAVALGRLGGLKGGPARAATLSKRKRRDIAKKAAAVRWKGIT